MIRGAARRHARVVASSASPAPRPGGSASGRSSALKPVQAIRSPLDNVAIAAAGAFLVEEWRHVAHFPRCRCAFVASLMHRFTQIAFI